MNLADLSDDELTRLYANVYAERVRRALIADPNANIAALMGGAAPKAKAKKAPKPRVDAGGPAVSVECIDCKKAFNTKVGCTRCLECTRKRPKVKCVQCGKNYQDWGIVGRAGRCATCAGVFAVVPGHEGEPVAVPAAAAAAQGMGPK